ncbi:LysR family transcriptional regulator [Agrobacterium sp. NPDC089420]|uniref:LysR family transcriptional regulator n=1 Tax=Agrobacterium sp. NPDC089420 TaxID=3363918 RepID=UPI00384C7C57
MIKQSYLDAFYFAMTTGSVSAAARALRVSQPTVSRLIREMEDEIGLELFNRRQGRIFPNARATELLEIVKQKYAALQSVDEAVAKLSRNLERPLSIATIPVLSATVLPQALACPTAPAREYHVLTIENHEVSKFLAEKPDFLCVTSDVVRDPLLETHILLEAELVVALSRKHPLASRPSISLFDLHDVPLAKGEGPEGVFNQIDVALKRCGAKPNVRYRSTRSDFLYRIVEQTDCCAIVEPFGYFSANRDAVTIRSINVKLPIVYRCFSVPRSDDAADFKSIRNTLRKTFQTMFAEIKRACAT